MLAVGRLSHQLRPALSCVRTTQPLQMVASDVRRRVVKWPPATRARSAYVPHDQYEYPIPKIMNPLYVMRVNWEIIPLVFVTCVSYSLMVCETIWSCLKCVDVVFTTHSRCNHSHTMDLCNPTVHKIIIINQRYKPWPEMQCVLDKMKTAEKKLSDRVKSCSFAQ